MPPPPLPTAPAPVPTSAAAARSTSAHLGPQAYKLLTVTLTTPFFFRLYVLKGLLFRLHSSRPHALPVISTYDSHLVFSSVALLQDPRNQIALPVLRIFTSQDPLALPCLPSQFCRTIAWLLVHPFVSPPDPCLAFSF